MNKTTLPDARAEKAVERLKRCQASGDIEMAHAEADTILCDLLRELNFGDVGEEWQKVEKWYA